MYLADIAANAQFIEDNTRGHTYDTFILDEVCLRAVLQGLIVIGEAVKHIPDEVRQRAPDIPWREIAGTRDIIVHGYFALNLPIVWDIVQREIPSLRQHVEKLLSELSPNPDRARSLHGPHRRAPRTMARRSFSYST
ncbi:MAG: DUF86 domain-containing protein [Chloroflexota bacterium]